MDDIKNISVFIDGTWSEPSDGTNVYRLSQLAQGTVIYLGGPGNQDDNGLLGQLFGGAFGAGSEKIVRNAESELMQVYERGDQVYVFGFSRGAALARILCSRLLGKVTVDFLGCWDTVASFGIPINVLGIKFQRINLFKGKDLFVSVNVRRAVHLLAFHETRHAFTPTLMNYLPNVVEEIWFPGTHEDIGSSNRTLSYMAESARSSGLEVDTVYGDTHPVEINWNMGVLDAYKQGPRETRVLRNGATDHSLKPWLHSSIIDGFNVVD